MTASCGGRSGTNAGFSTGEPWLPIAPSYEEQNVATQRSDNDSLYNLYRRLIALRHSRPSLTLGGYRPLFVRGDLLLFARELGNERTLVALNMGSEPTSVAFDSGGLAGRLVVSSFGDRDGEPINGRIDLRADEGAVIELSQDGAP